MNKAIIWIVVTIAILLIGFFIYSGDSDETQDYDSGSDDTVDDSSTDELSPLDTEDQVFDALEDALGYLE